MAPQAVRASYQGLIPDRTDVIPLTTFRQIAFTMSVGLLLDTLLVRPVLTPAVLVLLGRASGWPGRRIRTTSALRGERNRSEAGA